MNAALLYVKIIGRELLGLIRDAPRLLAERIDAFVKHEHAKDTLTAVVGAAAPGYLYAARGNAHIALDIAQTGIHPADAMDYRDQGFSPESIRTLAHISAQPTDPGSTT